MRSLKIRSDFAHKSWVCNCWHLGCASVHSSVGPDVLHHLLKVALLYEPLNNPGAAEITLLLQTVKDLTGQSRTSSIPTKRQYVLHGAS